MKEFKMAEVRGVGPYFLQQTLGKGQTGKTFKTFLLIYIYNSL